VRQWIKTIVISTACLLSACGKANRQSGPSPDDHGRLLPVGTLRASQHGAATEIDELSSGFAALSQDLVLEALATTTALTLNEFVVNGFDCDRSGDVRAKLTYRGPDGNVSEWTQAQMITLSGGIEYVFRLRLDNSLACNRLAAKLVVTAHPVEKKKH
jgi:hypothetical protein